MSNKVFILYLCIFGVILTACSSNGDEKGAAETEGKNEEKYEKVKEYDKLMQNAEKELNRDNLEEARETYIEAQKHNEDDNLDTKIENLETFMPLVDDALFDYLITVGDKEYQILIHSEDYDHTTASRDDDTTWACADEGEELYEGD